LKFNRGLSDDIVHVDMHQLEPNVVMFLNTWWFEPESQMHQNLQTTQVTTHAHDEPILYVIIQTW
jgi:hypothetical protein